MVFDRGKKGFCTRSYEYSTNYVRTLHIEVFLRPLTLVFFFLPFGSSGAGKATVDAFTRGCSSRASAKATAAVAKALKAVAMVGLLPAFLSDFFFSTLPGLKTLFKTEAFTSLLKPFFLATGLAGEVFAGSKIIEKKGH